MKSFGCTLAGKSTTTEPARRSYYEVWIWTRCVHLPRGRLKWNTPVPYREG